MNSGNLNPINGSHIVAMPYPGRGHINPMINLCNLLSSKGILVTIVLTEEWLGLLGGSVPGPSNIRLLSIPNVIPSEHNRAANFVGFLDAVFGEMEGPFDELLDRIEEKTSCIVADTFLPWMPAVGIRRGIPVVALSTMVPSMFSLFYHFDILAARRHFFPQDDLSERGEEIIDYIPGMSPMHLADLPAILVGKSGSVLKHIVKAYSSSTQAQAILFTSFYDLQPHLINTLRATLPIPIYTIGPSIPHFFLKHPKSDPTLTRHMSVSHWLDTCPQTSVLYVSLGSFLSTSEEQIRELLTGLCDSGFKFLWVARGEALGLQEACGEAGLIVPWCDQLRVLCHSAVGGFLTHCGWNSTMESIFAGVPMLTFPLAADQILNSKLIVEDWKVGLRLKERVGGENVIGRKEIGEKVKRLMDLNLEESKELRKRAKELKETCSRAIERGGSSDSNIDAFVKDFCTRPM